MGGPWTRDTESHIVSVSHNAYIHMHSLEHNHLQASNIGPFVFEEPIHHKEGHTKGHPLQKILTNLLGRALEEQPAFISGGHASEPNPGLAKREDAVVFAFGGHAISLRGCNPFNLSLFDLLYLFLAFHLVQEAHLVPSTGYVFCLLFCFACWYFGVHDRCRHLAQNERAK